MPSDTLESNNPRNEVVSDDRYGQYLGLIRKWNRVAALVSPRDAGQLETRHLEDSLALLEYLQDVSALLDVGSGGGFPAIPIAIANPRVKVSLVERSQKKCGFLRHVAMSLGLTNVEILECDVREVKRPQSGFDAITARAVAAPEQIWTWCWDLLAENGRLLLPGTAPSVTALVGGEITTYRSRGIGYIHEIRKGAR